MRAGAAAVRFQGAAVSLAENSAIFLNDGADIRAGSGGARLLRWDVREEADAESGLATGDGVSSTVSLRHRHSCLKAVAFKGRCSRMSSKWTCASSTKP